MPVVSATTLAPWTGPSQIGQGDPSGALVAAFPLEFQAVSGITAHAGGGQTSATALTSVLNRITVCATLNDSVILPTSAPGMFMMVRNDGAAGANVFPASGENFNGGSANAAFAVANAKSAIFFCTVAGVWSTLLSA